jgi:long-chain acyl-CoA synthetase
MDAKGAGRSNVLVSTAARAGMLSGLYAGLRPDVVAVADAASTRSFAELHANANRLSRVFRNAGLRPGDGLALMCGNRVEFIETFLAAMRVGLRLTPVNWHLSATEAAYIVADCEAKALVCEGRFAAHFAEFGAPGVRLAIGGASGFEDFGATLAAETESDPAAPELGTIMLYTSGTTGRPKGVLRRHPEVIEPQLSGTFADYRPETDVNLCCGPAYHAAPLLFDLRWPLASGVPIILQERWDSVGALAAIEAHKITHCHLTPINFHRLLALPREQRERADVSSLRRVFHGAAPCPVDVKRAMIEWWGPVLWEYYAASEGGAGIHINSEDWLAKPGTVGKRPSAAALRILREDGVEAAVNEDGQIHLAVSNENPFEYFNAPEKTESAHNNGYFALGDIGRLDADDYLFLTGRTAECIISGGVNIYPQEIDDTLAKHPAIEEACAIGAPNAEWGEEVRACVVLRAGHAGDANTAADILAFARAHLSSFKCPKAIDFVSELPRTPSGKIQRGLVRARYWRDRESAI